MASETTRPSDWNEINERLNQEAQDKLRQVREESATKGSLAASLAGIARSLPPGGMADPNRYPLPKALVGRQYHEFHNKDLNNLSNWDHENILKVLRQISPEASQAISTYLRIFDSGYTVEVTKMNGQPHVQGKDRLLQIIEQFEAYNVEQFCMPNTIRDMALKFALDALVKGACAGELQIGSNLQPLEIGYVDPFTIHFEWQPAPEKRWIPRQYALGTIVILDIPSFYYIPVDPLGNDPYGEEQLTSAIRGIIFKAMVLQDLRMAIHVNGWPRLDISVLEEVMMKNVPAAIQNDPVKLNEWMTTQLQQIMAAYQALPPDSNLIHTDSVVIKGIEAGTKGAMFNPTSLLDAIDDSITSGLKTFSVLLSKNFGGGTEGATSAQVVLYVKLVQGFQQTVAAIFERALGLALRLNGIVANVKFKFNVPEVRSDIELSQYRTVEMANITMAYNEQAIGQVERQERIRGLLGFTGPIPADTSEERIVNHAQPNQPERPASAEPGKEKKRKETNRRRRSGETPPTE